MKVNDYSLQLIKLLLVISISLCISVGEVLAHDLGLTRLELTQVSGNTLHLEAKLPAKLDSSLPEAPDGCSVVKLSQTNINQLNKLVSWEIDCPEINGLPEKIVLDWKREAALVISKTISGDSVEKLIDAKNGIIELNSSDFFAKSLSRFALVLDYIKLGIEHILIGLDHLAFVLGLFLIAKGWKLVKLVTAFTVGHSLSLAASSLGLLAIPVPPTEAVIALSVAFIFREAMLAEERRRHNALLVVLFGLLHGLGFASVLSELGVSSTNVLLSIVSFNIGVEIGQLIFIAFLLLTTTILNSFQIFKPAAARQAIAFSLGSVAIFWTFDRVIALL